MTRELVVAAYDNYLTWLDLIDPEVKITIYRKGDEEPQWDDEIILTPNKGRCVHTFFNHIYTNYNNLSDITFFAQDYPFDHWEDIVEVINDNTESKRCQLQIGGYYGFHFNSITVPSQKGGIMWNLSPSQHHGTGNVLICNSDGSPQDKNPSIDVDKYWSQFFNCLPPTRYEFMPGGHFGITKDHAQLRPREFYKQVVDLLLKEEVAPWIIERLECYIFNPTYK